MLMVSNEYANITANFAVQRMAETLNSKTATGQWCYRNSYLSIHTSTIYELFCIVMPVGATLFICANNLFQPTENVTAVILRVDDFPKQKNHGEKFFLYPNCFVNAEPTAVYHGGMYNTFTMRSHFTQILYMFPHSTVVNNNGVSPAQSQLFDGKSGYWNPRTYSHAGLFPHRKLATFNRERIPERVVHAKGGGAHGEFVVTNDISRFTKAKLFNGVGKKTRCFARFSTVGGNLGSADTAVDPHGFAVKFYTEDGNYDLVGNNIEVFPIRDPMLFSDLNRSRKRNPSTNLQDQTMWWDFVQGRPESTFHALQIFSDIGRAHGFRRMNGSSVHAFKFVNSRGDIVFAKLQWRSQQQAPALTFQQANTLQGTNPDYFVQDLYDSIENRNYPSWLLYIQLMTVEQAQSYPRNPFDITRNWREEEFQLIELGRMTLNRNPTNYFAEVEQAAFAVSNLVPGIEPSPDRMMHGRLLAYQDAQRYRLGTNFPQLPINSPIVEVNSYIRDGKACYGDNGGGSPNYWPNSFGGHQADPGVAHVSFSVSGVVDRFDIPEDEFVETRWFLERDVTPAGRQRMLEAIADHLKNARPEVQARVLQNNFYPISREFGDAVSAELQKAIRNANKSYKK
ncbi:Catalase [Orchesella cincta]|uniref:Catalase n=1 Tax=Orchesella cincta TaxID=48709 RepID=A0A1D2MLA0_ORCCI|nr:Catalase [Orchesella cincta]